MKPTGAAILVSRGMKVLQAARQLILIVKPARGGRKIIEDEFPPEAIRILRSARWDHGATKWYEALSGGFWWTDEFPKGLVEACRRADSWAFRFLLGYRASLVSGRPREELSRPWRQLERECPDWPGFRPERRSAELLAEQEAESRRVVAELESLFDPEPKA